MNGAGINFSSWRAQEGIVPALRYAPEQHGLFALVSPFRGGAELGWDNSLVLGENILYPKAEKTPRVASRAFKGLDSFDDLRPGDLLVHKEYGHRPFCRLHHLDLNAAANDFILVEYSGRDKLYVPVDRLGLLQRFKGTEGAEPPWTAWAVRAGRPDVKRPARPLKKLPPTWWKCTPTAR